MSARKSENQEQWQWENATAGAIAGFATVAALHPFDVVRTRFQGFPDKTAALLFFFFFFFMPSSRCVRTEFQAFFSDGYFWSWLLFEVNDGRQSVLPFYKNTGNAIFAIARAEGLRGLYAGFYPAVFGSTLSWGLYFFFYSRAKHRYLNGTDEKLGPSFHLLSATEAGALVCLFTNPVWLVKTRLQLQTPIHQSRPYSGFSDALRTILKEEGWRALYKGIGPGLLLVSHGAIQFTTYEELRDILIQLRSDKRKQNHANVDTLLNSVDYAMLGASSKVAAILLTYPYQVIRARLQQRPSADGSPKYMDSWHVVKETVRFEGIRGFYRGITANLIKNVPAASITFVVYEKVLSLLRLTSKNNN